MWWLIFAAIILQCDKAMHFWSCLSPARRSSFRVSHHATYCARRSLTSYRPDVHTCSHFCTRVRRRHMPREAARAPPQVPQYFDGARANESLSASYRMALTGERKNPKRIAGEIDVSMIETQCVWICGKVRLTIFNALFNPYLILYLIPFKTSFNTYLLLYRILSLVHI